MKDAAPPVLAPIPVVSSIAPLAAHTAAWLADIWGVMHNGVRQFEAACHACERFRAGGGTVLLLSNAPRPADGVVQQLDRIGVPRQAYDAIISSGDAARTFITELGGRLVFHLGPERDLPLYTGLDVRRVAAEAAEVVVCTGLFDDEVETPDDYAALLRDFAARRLPMICANPDLTVERGGKIVSCAGAVAAAYEAIGGAVRYAGKPHLPVYDLAFATIARLRGGTAAKDKVLAIGDGIRTDIAGAAAAGVASVYIASAVHMEAGAALDAAALDRLFPDPAVRPVAAMTGLRW